MERERQIIIMTGSQGTFARITSGGIKKSLEEEEEEGEFGTSSLPSVLLPSSRLSVYSDTVRVQL